MFTSQSEDFLEVYETRATPSIFALPSLIYNNTGWIISPNPLPTMQIVTPEKKQTHAKLPFLILRQIPSKVLQIP